MTSSLASFRLWAVILGMACGAANATPPSPADGDALRAAFLDPPAAARPRVWWHWINGNVTEDGIAKDLAWMKRVGIGGFQMFDVGLTTRQIVERRLAFMTPEWKKALRFAASRADALGLEMTISSSPGWSETGGPWVQPRDAMKKLVWSEISIPGEVRYHDRLPMPPQVTGPFEKFANQNQAATYYADAVVLAVPDDTASTVPVPHYSADGGAALDAGALLDDDPKTGERVVGGADGRAPAIVIRYDTPQTIRSATLFVPDASTIFSDAKILPRLEVRDGSGWRALADMPLSRVPTTVGFPPVKASEFRLIATPKPGAGDPPRQIRVTMLRLSIQPRIDQFEVKAGFDIAPDYEVLPGGQSTEAGVRPSDVVDLTGRLAPDGTLDWTPPKGRWRVLRLGASLLGVTNHPAAAEGTGLEVDKYDGAAVRRYLATYLGMYRDAVGPALIGERGIRAILTDSIEVGASNWTPGMIGQFRRLRGYDPRPWLPALTGVIIGSRRQSDAFLFDYRRTLADLIASEHYGEVARAAHAAGLQVYGESQEGGRTSLGDDMSMRAHADVPMAALWTFDRATGPAPGAPADMRGAASVAHVYGRKLVAAEALTASMKPWAFAPADLRPIIDLAFASGINRPVIHTSVHQPLDRAPGLSLAIFGQYFNRLDTWAELARPWVDYLARSSLLLQQGRNVADVAYFSGEEGPLTALHGDEPVRYAYDFVNADMLRDALDVDGGVIVAKGGARYRLLYLGGTSRHMSLSVLRRIEALADAGATIAGGAPVASPSLIDDAGEFARIVRRLWAGGAVTNVGRGQVIAGPGVEAALARAGVAPDFDAAGTQPNRDVMFVHRALDDGDLYYLSNRRNRAEPIDATFRVAGKVPEIWRADAGSTAPVSYRTVGTSTVVPLTIAAEDSFFVLFRKPATVDHADVVVQEPAAVATLGGAWQVMFQADRGAPSAIMLPALASLAGNPDPGVRYFSGTATYRKAFQRPAMLRPGAPLWLDLGTVADVAEVRVNGESVGIAWRAPYRLDIGPFVKRGANRLEVKVANLWVNRLIGDAQPGAVKITSTLFPTYKADAPLRPSGLIGPVRLLASSKRRPDD